MQRPRGRSRANACALALLAGAFSFNWAAPYSLGNPHKFAMVAPAAVAAEEQFVATHSLKLPAGGNDEAPSDTVALAAVQYDAEWREESVTKACEILTQRSKPEIAVAGVADADLGLKEASHTVGSDAAVSESIEELPPRVRIIEDYERYEFDNSRWQWLPTGLIYRSYMAGVHEPRASLVSFHEGADRTLWDATLGGRFGIVRCGDCDPFRPHGWQVDFYGAAISRLDVENQQDLDSTDYVFGVPLTYGTGDWQFKFGYAHLSSHLGDELALRDPATLDARRNYVRDAIVFGTSVFLHPVWRQYGEVGWAFHHSGGAQPWEAQFGTELSLPGPGTSPFFAVNGRMREEHDFGGDLTVQAGWLRRGGFGQTMRLGAHYYNGKSSQFQFFDDAEEQVGLGLWYDF